MNKTLRLHYAPDHASGALHLALKQRGRPYETVLAKRRISAQLARGLRMLNDRTNSDGDWVNTPQNVLVLDVCPIRRWPGASPQLTSPPASVAL